MNQIKTAIASRQNASYNFPDALSDFLEDLADHYSGESPLTIPVPLPPLGSDEDQLIYWRLTHALNEKLAPQPGSQPDPRVSFDPTDSIFATQGLHELVKQGNVWEWIPTSTYYHHYGYRIRGTAVAPQQYRELLDSNPVYLVATVRLGTE